MEAQPVGTMAGAELEEVEHADAGGIRDDMILRGDEDIVRERRDRAVSGSRARAAVQAALDKIDATSAKVPIAADTLRKEREAVAERGNIVAKTAGKVATDEHTWDLYVEEQGLQIGDYPSEEQTVEFAVWLSMRRERACLAQRPEAGAKLSGLVKRTVRNTAVEVYRDFTDPTSKAAAKGSWNLLEAGDIRSPATRHADTRATPPRGRVRGGGKCSVVSQACACCGAPCVWRRQCEISCGRRSHTSNAR